MVTSRSCGGDLGGQRAQQGGLADAGAAGDQDVLAGADRGGQELRQRRRSTVPRRARSSRVTWTWRWRRTETHGRRVTDMTANSRDPSGSWMVSRGLARSNRRSSVPARAAIGADQLDQVGVGGGDRGGPGDAAVGVPDEHLVAAVDVDVLDLRVIEQRLQAAQAEQRGGDRAGDPLLRGGVQGRLPGPQRRGGAAPPAPGRSARSRRRAARPAAARPGRLSSRSWAWRASAAATWARSWPVTACSSGPPVTAPAPGQGIAAGASGLVLTVAP